MDPKRKAYDVADRHVRSEIRSGNTVTLMTEVDLSEVELLREAAARADERKPSYTALVVKAVALALRDFPYANRRIVRRPWLPFSGARLQQFERADVAVAFERELPGVEVATCMDVLRDADKLGLPETTDWLHALLEAEGTSNAQWDQFVWIVTHLPARVVAFLMRLQVLVPSLWIRYRGSAALVSSPAKYGVDIVAASWPWPLGVSFGVVRSRPIVRNGCVTVGRTFWLTLNFDRRLMAGAPGARFFVRIVQILERAVTEMQAFLPPGVEVPASEPSSSPSALRPSGSP
ncbi:MAG TPA: 2-oxo acid dehydrogenase subunit E2 [Thermoanaerobaculia bacterium]|jgi:pyruvate/2-oxoglutarate dehydrogenase complex dihydrolipoamide acyltransferase (E2) component|nr:2-oxo acid dehydrogenase subunit E2 [Thermoanaerobaculia bacterium]